MESWDSQQHKSGYTEISTPKTLEDPCSRILHGRNEDTLANICVCLSAGAYHSGNPI